MRSRKKKRSFGKILCYFYRFFHKIQLFGQKVREVFHIKRGEDGEHFTKSPSVFLSHHKI